MNNQSKADQLKTGSILKIIGTIILLVVASLFISFLIFKEPLMRSMAIGTVPLPKQLTRDDFPPYNIDITKYFQPVEFKYDPTIKVSRGFDDIGYIEHETNPYVIDVGEYAHHYAGARSRKLCNEGKIPESFCSGMNTEMDKCLAEAYKKYGHFMQIWDKVCKEEKITEQYVENSLGYLCKLPDEISYQFFVKEYDEKNKCVDKIVDKFNE